MAKIPQQDVAPRLQKLPGWTLAGEAISRQFTFAGFHHPDLVVNYKRVTVTYSTHSEGGLSDKDFAGAETATKIATGAGGT